MCARIFFLIRPPKFVCAVARPSVLPALAVVALALAGCETLDTKGVSQALATAMGNEQAGLSTNTIAAGLKEALKVGARNTVQQTSKTGGYSSNPAIRIPLPDRLKGMANALRKVGLGGQVDAFETKLNRAAETAAVEAAPVFMDAIKDMTIADARRLLRGSDTAATDYFRRNTYDTLTKRYTPIVQDRMNEVGAVRLFETLQNRYNQLPLMSDMDYQIEDYVVSEALDGLFTVLANEEKRIREDPAARTTELLKRVFSN